MTGKDTGGALIALSRESGLRVALQSLQETNSVPAGDTMLPARVFLTGDARGMQQMHSSKGKTCYQGIQVTYCP